MEQLSQSILEILNYPFFQLGNNAITIASIFRMIIYCLLLYVLTHLVANKFTSKILSRTSLDVGRRQAATSIIKYVILIIGLVVIFQNIGLDMSGLTILTGAFGLGIGFGLQNIISNFISGIIILFERPIKVGDRIQIDNLDGDVTFIGARSTHVLSNNNITVIVPNQKFITDKVINWTVAERLVRFCVPIAVIKGSDLRFVEKLLLEVADENEDVVKTPAPGVRFMRFGEYGYELELRVWSTNRLQRKNLLISSINFAIYDKFKEHDIKTASVSVDMYLHGGQLNITGAEGLPLDLPTDLPLSDPKK